MLDSASHQTPKKRQKQDQNVENMFDINNSVDTDVVAKSVERPIGNKKAKKLVQGTLNQSISYYGY